MEILNSYLHNFLQVFQCLKMYVQCFIIVSHERFNICFRRSKPRCFLNFTFSVRNQLRSETRASHFALDIFLVYGTERNGCVAGEAAFILCCFSSFTSSRARRRVIKFFSVDFNWFEYEILDICFVLEADAR